MLEANAKTTAENNLNLIRNKT